MKDISHLPEPGHVALLHIGQQRLNKPDNETQVKQALEWRKYGLSKRSTKN